MRDVDPWAAMFNPAVRTQFLHMLPATYIVTGCLFASVYAVGWLRGRRDDLHRLGVRIPLTVLAIAAPVQLITGDCAIRYLADSQPAKFAAMELVPDTRAHQPVHVRWRLRGRTGQGCDRDPRPRSRSRLFTGARRSRASTRSRPRTGPPVNVVRTAFEIMVTIGTALLAPVWLAILLAPQARPARLEVVPARRRRRRPALGASRCAGGPPPRSAANRGSLATCCSWPMR